MVQDVGVWLRYEYDVDFALCYLTTHPSDLVGQSVAYTSLRSPRCHAILTFSIDNSIELPGVAFQLPLLLQGNNLWEQIQA